MTAHEYTGPWGLARPIAVVAALCISAVAVAGAGEHIKVGDTTITPSVDVGVEYQTNPLQRPTDPISGANLRVAPSLEVEVEGADNSFSLGADYWLQKYFSSRLTSLDRFNNFDINAKLSTMKSRRVGFDVWDRMSLINDPTNSLADPYQTRFRNDLGASVKIRPGQVLQFGAGGGWTFDDYRVPSGAQIIGGKAFNRRNAFGALVDGEWKFFPRTAIVFNAEYIVNRWDKNWIPTGQPGGAAGQYLALPDSNEFRARVGIRGRFAARLVLGFEVGYGSSNYLEDSVTDSAALAPPTNGAEADPLIAGFDAKPSGADRLLFDVQLRYEIDETKKISLGYQKDNQDSYFTNYVSYNRIYAKSDNRFGRWIGLNIEAAFRQEAYRGVLDRDDLRFDAVADFTVFMQEWASITAGVNYFQRWSSDATVDYNDLNIHVLTTIQY